MKKNDHFWDTKNCSKIGAEGRFSVNIILFWQAHTFCEATSPTVRTTCEDTHNTTFQNHFEKEISDPPLTSTLFFVGLVL